MRRNQYSSNTQQQKRTFPFNEVLCSLINCGKLFLWNISRTGYIICFKRTFVNSVEVSIVVSDVEYCWLVSTQGSLQHKVRLLISLWKTLQTLLCSNAQTSLKQNMLKFIDDGIYKSGESFDFSIEGRFQQRRFLLCWFCIERREEMSEKNQRLLWATHEW